MIRGYFRLRSKFGGLTIQPWTRAPPVDVYQISHVPFTVQPLDFVTAYATFANLGVAVEPRLVDRVEENRWQRNISTRGGDIRFAPMATITGAEAVARRVEAGCDQAGQEEAGQGETGRAVALAFTDAAGAPESTIMDETHKVAVTRLGDRIRVGGTAELAGYTLQLHEPRRRTLEHVKLYHCPLGSEADAAMAQACAQQLAQAVTG